MCGICGLVSLDGTPLPDPRVLDTMAASLAHRGPDGYGAWRGPAAALAAHRLRIRDLDPRADQPFGDPAGDCWLVGNGELYNAAELRARHPRWPYRSAGDLETILPLYRRGGPAALAALDGMYAVALWDAGARRLVLARDRAGEKPLFYARRGALLAFASEIQALLAVPGVGRELDDDALAEFLTLGSVSEPRTPFAAVRRVPAGSIVEITAGGTTLTRHWHPFDRSDPPSVEELRDLLAAAVERQLVADVPLGVFLSGGLDSTLLTALAVERLGPGAVRTFSVGFPDASYDERAFARRVSRHLGTPHVEVLADDAALAHARARAHVTAEPIADPALLPTILLAEAARREVGVVLSGEGADELFGGYPTYVGHRLVPAWRALPRPLRAGLRLAVNAWPASRRRVPLGFLLQRFVAGAERPWRARHVGWYGTGLPHAALAPALRALAAERNEADRSEPDDPVRQAMAFDYETGLRDRLLPKIDRATMLAGLEARAPFLDPALTRAAFAASGGDHVRGLRTKRLLREVARPWVPRYILRRRKQGLSVPVSTWLAGALAPEVDRLLAPARLKRQALLDPAVVARLWADHRARRADHGRALWALVALQDWLETWGPEGG